MHPTAAKEIVALCRRRLAQGDCPSDNAPSAETLEDAVIALAGALERIANLPSDLPCEVCGHPKSQHLAFPLACADCMRENNPDAFHAFSDDEITSLRAIRDELGASPGRLDLTLLREIARLRIANRELKQLYLSSRGTTP